MTRTYTLADGQYIYTRGQIDRMKRAVDKMNEALGYEYVPTILSHPNAKLTLFAFGVQRHDAGELDELDTGLLKAYFTGYFHGLYGARKTNE